MHGNLKKVPKFSHSHISQSQWWNCGSITVMNFLSYQNCTTQLFRKLCLTNWARILIWIVIDFIKNYRHILFKTDYQNYVPYKDICVHNLCRFSDTGIIMTSHRRCYARDLKKTCIDFLQCMILLLPLRNFACKFRLRNVSKPNNSCHNRI